MDSEFSDVRMTLMMKSVNVHVRAGLFATWHLHVTLNCEGNSHCVT